MTNNEYLLNILNNNRPKDLSSSPYIINNLKSILTHWAGLFLIDIKESGSIAKGTAVHPSSDIDYIVSLSHKCDCSLQSIYESLYETLEKNYSNIRKQNVSIRISQNNFKIDITPARQQYGYINRHSIYVSKKNSWTKTNIQEHINIVSNSGRTDEIKLLKIWREKNNLDFPSIYMEILLIKEILYNKSKSINFLAENFFFILKSFAKHQNNPLFYQIQDPANTNNILSDLLDSNQKRKIIYQAQNDIKKEYWSNII